MAYLIAVLSTLTLFMGFVALTYYEARHTRRFFPLTRARLDANVERIEFVLAHVDLNAFLKEEIHHALNRIGHTVAHISLQVVRAIERLLTRIVRHFRMRNEDGVAPRESTREFVKTLSDFKDTLKTTHPDISVPEVE